MSFLANFGIKYFADKQEQARIAALPDVTDDAVVKSSRPKSSRHVKPTSQKPTSRHVDTSESPVMTLSKAKERLNELKAVDLTGKSANVIKRHKGKMSQARKAVAAAHAALYGDVAEGEEEEKTGTRVDAAGTESEVTHEEQQPSAVSRAAAAEFGWLLALNASKPPKKSNLPTEEPTLPAEAPNLPVVRPAGRPAGESADRSAQKPAEAPQKEPAEKLEKTTAERLMKKPAEGSVMKPGAVQLTSNARTSDEVSIDKGHVHPTPGAAGGKKNEVHRHQPVQVASTAAPSNKVRVDTAVARPTPRAGNRKKNSAGNLSPVHVEHGSALHVLKACSAINCRPTRILARERNPYAFDRGAPKNIVQQNQLRQQALFQTPIRPSRSLTPTRTSRAAANDSRSRSLSPDKTPRAAANDSNPSSPVAQIISRDPFSEDDFSGVMDLNGYPMSHVEFRNATLNCLQHIRQGSPLWDETKRLLWHILGNDQFYGMSGTNYTYRQMFAMLGKDVLGVDTEENDEALKGQEGDVKSKAAGGQ